MIRGKTELDTLRLNGWDKIGTILEGTEYNSDGKFHTDKIKITAIGEESFLCKWLYQDKADWSEEKGNATLQYREWKFYGSESYVRGNSKELEKTKLEVQGIVDIFETEFNVGDEVFSTLYGWGKVIDYDASSDYPVNVATISRYKNCKLTLEYTADGRNFGDEGKSLFHTKEDAIVHIRSLERNFIPLTFDYIKRNCIIGETILQYSTHTVTYEFTYFGFTSTGWLVTEDKHTANDEDLHGLQLWSEYLLETRKMVVLE